jgi:allophanate hydrolase
VVRGILEGATRYSAKDAFEASYRLAEIRRRTEPVWQQIDALLVPSVPSHYTIEAVLADPIGLNQNLGTYTNFVNLLDLSALAMPEAFRENGLPFGVTLIGPAFADAKLFELARRRLGETEPTRTAPAPGWVWLAVAGAHLSGQPLNHELVNRGARLLKTAQTAAEYRLFALDTQPRKPGLVHAPSGAGRAIEVEIWELDQRAFGSFVAGIPAPMTIGTTRLADGSSVKGFSCEPHALEGALEISEYGGWRAFLSQSPA